MFSLVSRHPVYGNHAAELAEDSRLCLTFAMVKNSSRRNFLRTAPVAAGLVLTEPLLFAATAAPAPAPEKAKKGKTKASAATAGSMKAGKKEKIRFGQAPRNALPSVPDETLAPGADQGTDVASSGLPSQGAAISTLDQPTSLASDDLPLNPVAERKKTRYSYRAPIEDKARRDAAKEAKAKQLAAVAAPLPADEQLKQKAQQAALGLGGDTATKKKAKKVKGAPKERLQEQAPTPPAPKLEGTPIPPKSVRQNGEPVVNPPPAVPAVTAPADAPASPAAK